MTKFKWRFPENSMIIVKSINDLLNVVVTINAYRQLIDDIYIIELPVCLGLNPPIEVFIPYENLTKQIVDGWLNDNFNVVDLDNQLSNKLDDLKNPKTITLPNPF